MNDSPDLAAVTQVQQQIWSKGDFAMVASIVYNASRGPRRGARAVPDERVLDVACGSGNGAIAAARRTWGGTVGADYVPALLERGRERAAAERLEVEFVEADAQDLPFEDAQLRRRDVDLRRDVRPRPAEGRVRAAARGQARRPDRDGATGPRTAPSARCSRRSPSTRRRRPGSTRRCSGAPRSACASCSATGSPTCGSSAASRASRSAPPTTTSSSSAPTSARPRWPTNGSAPRASRRSPTTCSAFLEAANTAGDRALVLEAEYLQVIATRA